MKSCKIFVVGLCYIFPLCDCNLGKGNFELVFETGQNAFWFLKHWYSVEDALFLRENELAEIELFSSVINLFQ